MKFCEKHWEQLRQVIKDKGMWNLVSDSSQEVMSELITELKNEEHKFDPLMAAHNAITTAALDGGGLYLLSVDEDGNHYCPLCEVEKHIGDNVVENWINGSTDDCLNYCKTHGLLNLN